MTAGDVMTADVISVGPEASLRVVCELMRQNEIGAVPVVDVRLHVLGLVTDRDVVVRDAISRRCRPATS
jgi:CBS domain-containing protein